MTSLLEYLPRGNMLDGQEWRKRHSFLQWILFVHLPGLFLFGLALHHSARISALTLVPPLVCLLLGRLVPHRRLGSLFITAGLVCCSAALVVLSRGSIEAHFHFFIVIGFIALYQDWLPFLWNIVFTVMSHGLGSAVSRDLIFDHQAGQASPWVWSGIHGLAVLAACIGVVVFWRTTEQEQEKSIGLARKLSETEIDRRKFASDMLVNLARRNQSLLYMLAELVENAVRFSPPEACVVIRVRPYPASPGAHVLTVEDCGIGMRPEDLAEANEPLANPREVDLSVSRRLGLHVVARLAERHGISVSLSPTPGSGVTAVVVLPPALFAELSPEPAVPTPVSQHPSPRPCRSISGWATKSPGRAGGSRSPTTRTQAWPHRWPTRCRSRPPCHCQAGIRHGRPSRCSPAACLSRTSHRSCASSRGRRRRPARSRPTEHGPEPRSPATRPAGGRHGPWSKRTSAPVTTVTTVTPGGPMAAARRDRGRPDRRTARLAADRVRARHTPGALRWDDAVTPDGATGATGATPDGRHGRDRADRVVPVYAFTRGRTRSTGRELPIETLVTATELAARHERDTSVQVEWRAIMKICRRPMSVAEIGIALGVPTGVARVLVSDLAGAGYLVVHLPQGSERHEGPGQAVLERLLDGLRSR